MDRIITSFFKASSKCLIGFSICIIILSLGTYYIGGNIAPKSIFILSWMYLCLTIISTIELTLQAWNRWMSIPYWVKRVIFMPFYMVIIVSGVLNLGQVSNNIKRGVVCILAIGVPVYIISSIIKYFVDKNKTDEMNNALAMLQKEIEKEDEED